MHVIQMRQVSLLLPQNWVVRSPPYFAQGILGITPKLLQSEKCFETETIPPLQGVLMLRVLRGPNCKKILTLRTSYFGDMGSKVQLSHFFPKNWVGRSPPNFALGILGVTPKPWKFCDPHNPENFMKVSPPVSKIFGIFHFPKVSYLNNGVTILRRILCHTVTPRPHSVVKRSAVMMCVVRCGTCLQCSWNVPSLASITGSVHSPLHRTISMEAPTRPSRFVFRHCPERFTLVLGFCFSFWHKEM